MSHGILQTALTTALRLDLSYRQPSSQNEPAAASDIEGSTAGAATLQNVSALSYDTLFRMRWMFIGDVR